MYLSYSDYVGYGGKLEQNAFNRFEFRAGRMIDMYTQSRLKGIPSTSVPNEVKRCMFELVDYISSNLSNGTVKSVQSESNDGYSVSYSSDKSCSDEIYDIIYTYLSETDLMYMGVD